MLTLFIDADACPVKEEAFRVAARHGMPVFVVTCLAMRDPRRAGVTLVQTPEGPDCADDWIADHATPGDICITDDIPLASRVVKRGGVVLTGRGRLLDGHNIGEALATRDLMDALRGNSTLTDGRSGGGPSPFTKRDRSRFLEKLEHAVRTILRDNPESGRQQFDR